MPKLVGENVLMRIFIGEGTSSAAVPCTRRWWNS